MALRAVAFVTACVLMTLAGCVTTERRSENITSVTNIQEAAAILDGMRVTVEAYAAFRSGAISTPHDYLVLETAEGDEGQRDQSNLRCVGSRYRLYIGAPANRLRLRSLDHRHIIVSGVFHNEQSEVLHEPVTLQYDGYLSDVHIQQILGDSCKIK